ncbi:pyridoxamine--pyruvate transaminase [Labrys wisconsinensis]|uniref:Pyridoxamine--pyruvate transaminase n=1 Tax=Labrys wisconsinensis TaxID=425677 RepID=A0ABU0JBU0_9HYPH|nr:alanine--glyoxylate aminotransferase family protein [Labrys wisconsinensis]MDQ0471747.1 pyridoxamine--pyruvate transaminase [Labrys wisconsinensis]
MPLPPPLMLTTGPVTAYPEVLAAMARPVVYDTDPAFQGFYEGVVEKARAALRLSNPPVILQGEAILGIEAAAAGLIRRDDVVLNLVSGVYGKGFGGWASRHGREVIELAVPYDAAIDPAAVAEALRRRPDIAVVSVCHLDTPSGTINPLAEIGAVVARHGGYMIVDAVSSFGGMDVHPEEVDADIFCASPSKCLGGTPGLTLLGVSERAWARIADNPDAPRASFLSLLDWRHAWRRDRPFPVTPSIPEIYGLDAALERYAAEGPEAVWARHALTARAARAGVRALGLELWPRSEAIAAPTATVFKLPAGISDEALRDRMRDRFGVLVSLGRRETAGKVLRLGHMGPAAQPVFAVTAIAALGAALRSLGLPAAAEAGVAAALAVIAGPASPTDDIPSSKASLGGNAALL